MCYPHHWRHGDTCFCTKYVHFCIRRNAVAELFNWCRRQGLPVPTFSYMTDANKRECAVVRLPNGSVYQGSYARCREKAAESAAGIALLSQVRYFSLDPRPKMLDAHLLSQEYKFLSVDKECSPVTSLLTQILGHRVFMLDPWSGYPCFFSHVVLGLPRGLVPFNL